MRAILVIPAITVLTLIQVGCRNAAAPTAQSAQVVPSPQHSALKTCDAPEAYAVYRALLGVGSEDNVKNSESNLALRVETATEKTCPVDEISSDPRTVDAASDYTVRSQRPFSLVQDDLKLGRKMQFVSQSELHAIFATGVGHGWKDFHTRYPNLHGYLEVSAVGFNSDKSFAILYSAVHCGADCGTGGFITLSKTQGKWQKSPTRSCSWVS